jgi:hypothetical protein
VGEVPERIKLSDPATKRMNTTETTPPGSLERMVRLPRVKRGEYWVFALLDTAGKKIGNTWGGIFDRTFTVPATLAFKGFAAGCFESAEHGVVIYRQPNDPALRPPKGDVQ